MLLIAEIILTAFVWNKGWRWFSLLPVGIAVLVGIMLGLSGSTEIGGFVIFDILAIVALVIMLVNPKKIQN